MLAFFFFLCMCMGVYVRVGEGEGGCVYMCVHMCMLVCIHIHAHAVEATPHYSPSYMFWTLSLTALAWTLVIGKASWPILSRDPLVSVLSQFSAEATNEPFCTGIVCVCWWSKLRFSCLQGRHFSGSAISPDKILLFIYYSALYPVIVSYASSTSFLEIYFEIGC